MNISILKQPGRYCFIGNAVAFELQIDSYQAIIVDVICNGQTYKASYYPFKKGEVYYARFDIAGYLYSESTLTDYPLGQIVQPLAGFVIPYQVKIGEYVFDGIAFKGGIDDYTQSLLQKEGFDIFSYRLASYFDQFLFTTRTHNKTVKLRGSELYPFVFIHCGLPVTFKSVTGKTISTTPKAEGTVCVLDPSALRAEFDRLFNEIPNSIEVWIADSCSFTLQIMPAQVSEEKYLIRFRNSLGAFEVVEVTGTGNHEPEVSDSVNYQSLNEFDIFEEHRKRVSMREVIKVESGYKTRDEILFLRDLVCSEEAYFIQEDGSAFRCNVTVDKFAYRHKQITPTSIPLIVTHVNESRFISPSVDMTTLAESSGVFDQIFDETFG